MNAIRNWLYIGNYRDSRDTVLLSAREIGAVLQLAAAVSYPAVESLYLPVDDGIPLEDQYLQVGINFVLNQKQLERRVLVACGAGISRSAAFAVAVLKEAEGLGLLEALRVVKSHHPDTLIHPALWGSLSAYYREKVPYQSALKVIFSDK